jgi:hypothetical protein
MAIQNEPVGAVPEDANAGDTHAQLATKKFLRTIAFDLQMLRWRCSTFCALKHYHITETEPVHEQASSRLASSNQLRRCMPAAANAVQF